MESATFVSDGMNPKNVSELAESSVSVTGSVSPEFVFVRIRMKVSVARTSRFRLESMSRMPIVSPSETSTTGKDPSGSVILRTAVASAGTTVIVVETSES